MLTDRPYGMINSMLLQVLRYPFKSSPHGEDSLAPCKKFTYSDELGAVWSERLLFVWSGGLLRRCNTCLVAP